MREDADMCSQEPVLDTYSFRGEASMMTSEGMVQQEGAADGASVDACHAYCGSARRLPCSCIMHLAACGHCIPYTACLAVSAHFGYLMVWCAGLRALLFWSGMSAHVCLVVRETLYLALAAIMTHFPVCNAYWFSPRVY